MTDSSSTQGIGTESTAASSMITTGIRIMTGIRIDSTTEDSDWDRNNIN
jgi:hypothetical protein